MKITEKEILEAVLDNTISLEEAKILYEYHHFAALGPKTGKCPDCGSTDVELDNDGDVYECHNCGEKQIIVGKAKLWSGDMSPRMDLNMPYFQNMQKEVMKKKGLYKEEE